MSEYPKYRAKEVAGRTLWWEDLFAGLGHYHLRLYYPDHNGSLRLVFINDEAGKHKCTLVEQTLMQEFGITYRDLGVSAPDTQLAEYERLHNMDPLCTWPARLYPKGPPGKKAALKKAQLAARQHVAAFRALDTVMPVTAVDAWI